jgi:hypothetical protein
METAIVLTLAATLGYIVWQETRPETAPVIGRKRLCDYSCSGSVFVPAEEVIASGQRLLEVHLYADENDRPIVSQKSLKGGYNYAYDYWTFESVCRALIQAFPSPDPFILSIVTHTDSAAVLNRAAESLQTTVHRHLLPTQFTDVQTMPIDQLANRLIVVSANVQGTKLGDLVNLSWNESNVRHLTYIQAIHPRDQPELVDYNRNNITIVAPDIMFAKAVENPETALAYGCQWILFENSRAPGFVEKPVGLQ